MTAQDYRRYFNHLRNAMALGWMTYDEAKEMATPVLKEMNEKGKRIAKKYGKKFYPMTFTEVVR